MQKQSRPMLVGMALVVLSVLVNLGGTGRVIADAVKDVIVANTAANPVPTTIQGSLPAISGNVAVTNTPNVAVTNTPTVNVASLPTVLVQSRDEPARQPFQRFGSFQIEAPAFGGNDSFTVPAGKRLVIEYVSFRSNILTGANQIVSFSLGNQGGGSIGGFGFVPQTTIDSAVSTTGFIAHEPIRAYCDPGTSVTVTAIRNSTVGSDTVSYTLTGYFVDLP
jgi:hypothetical protein